ncbi:hypothetical protein GQ53DRAFT_379916 [Thozetella sp. PMI_491]|nr:hypothetical protein GQ53DRAFT_379916 [Thozetella sp. PMI_491]
MWSCSHQCARWRSAPSPFLRPFSLCRLIRKVRGRPGPTRSARATRRRVDLERIRRGCRKAVDSTGLMGVACPLLHRPVIAGKPWLGGFSIAGEGGLFGTAGAFSNRTLAWHTTEQTGFGPTGSVRASVTNQNDYIFELRC